MLTIESYRWNVTLNWIISFKFPNNINSLLFSHWNYSFYFKRKYISIRSFCYEMQTGKHISRRKKVLKCRMSVCLFVHLSIRLYVRLSVCLSIAFLEFVSLSKKRKWIRKEGKNEAKQKYFRNQFFHFTYYKCKFMNRWKLRELVLNKHVIKSVN